MSSVLTNSSAMTALRSLQMTNSSMETVQSRISTGLRVNDASDNASYWSIATSMRSDNSVLSTVQDSLGIGASKVDTAYTGMDASIKVVDEIKQKLVSALDPSNDKAKIQAEIGQLQEQLASNANSASFNGENWLSIDSANGTADTTKSIVSSFQRDSTGAVSVSTIDIDTSAIALYDANTGGAGAAGILDSLGADLTDAGNNSAMSVSNLDITGLSNGDIEELISQVDTASASMTTAASDLGSSKKRINLQSEFVGSLMDAVDRGIGKLVDADMTEESTKLQALQVQQQLGVQALSIANSNSQTILSLFR